MTGARTLAAAVGLAVLGLLSGCASVPARTVAAVPPPAGQVPVVQVPAAQVPVAQAEPLAAVRPSRALSLSIPSIGVRNLRIVMYVGWPDDLAGTRIEDRGMAASPTGSRGGVRPGQVGNFIVTAHRTSAGGPLRHLPELADGAHILVTSGSTVYDYVVMGTMSISFRSVSSLALQTAAVPGQPGQPATAAMITLSTCATLEDHAAGNYWADALGNPEHRIDKIGVLVAMRTS
jgi:sortase A